MAKTVWNGSSNVSVTINNIKQSTNISKYVFRSSDNTTATEYDSNSYFAVVPATLNGTKTITVYGKLKYKSGAYSNEASDTVTVNQKFDTTSVTGFSVSPTWCWSNEASKSLTTTITKSTSTAPASDSHTITSSQTTSAAGKGSIPNASAATGTTNALTWTKNSSSTDIGAASANITLTVKSTTTSAPSAADVRSATFTVRNALASLAASNITVYKGATSGNTTSVTFTPSVPYSKTLSVVAPSAGGSAPTAVTVSNGVLTLNTSTAGTYKFRVQSAAGTSNGTAITSSDITFTVTAVTAITGKNFNEGSSVTVADCGVGALTAYSFTSGGTGLTISKSGSTGITVSNSADITAATSFTVTVTGAGGATNTVSGTCSPLGALTAVNINPGDTYSWTSSTVGIGTVTAASSSDTGKVTVAVSSGTTTITAVAAGTSTITFTGTGGAKRTCSITVSNIGLTLA